MFRRAWLLLIVGVACGPRSQPGDASWFRGHASARESAPAERLLAGLSAADARAELARVEAEPAHLIIAGNRLVGAGGAPTSDERARVEAAIDEVSGSALAQLWSQLDPLWPYHQVALRRGLIAEHARELEEARRLLLLAQASPAPEALAARARATIASIDARLEVDPRRIAVLLPLSGRYAAIGRELKSAIELAASVIGGAELAFLDTTGEAEVAAALVERAVLELHAVAVLGPVGANESAAAAVRAVELGVPIALLSPDHHGAAADVGVFRLWSSPEAEAREAVRVAGELGYDQLAILAPRDEQGSTQVAAFQDEARLRGLAVVASGQYEPSATDLAPDIETFLGLDPRTNARLRRHLARYGVKKGRKTFSPEVPFELLFVPDEYQRAALVASYLPYFNVELRSYDVIDVEYLKRKHGGRVPRVVQLLGSSGWHHPGVIPRGGALLEGAMFLDVYAGAADEQFATEAGARFFERFERRAGRPPSGVAAQAHDAALLMLGARADAAKRAGSRPRTARAELTRSLQRGFLEDGACGEARVGPTGEIVRESVVLRIEGGQFVVPDP